MVLSNSKFNAGGNYNNSTTFLVSFEVKDAFAQPIKVVSGDFFQLLLLLRPQNSSLSTPFA
jgi:hypothetical protein